MSEFRKHFIRESAVTEDYEQEEDFFRITKAQNQLDELMQAYYGLNTSFLPYTHDETISGTGTSYSFNYEAAELFIDELLGTIDEQYWLNYPLPDDFFDNFNEDTKQFYRSFLYLAIRIASIKPPKTKPDGHHADVGNGTFNDLYILADSMVIPYSEAGFHRRFEIGIQDRELPQMFFDIQKICCALGKENCFLHTSNSAEDEENKTALKEDAENEILQMQMIADVRGLSYEQLKANDDYLRESKEYLLKKENEEFKKKLGYFEDENTFIKYASTYRDLIFHYNTTDIKQYITNAIKLFLLRNGHSVLSEKKTFSGANAEIGLAIDKLKKLETQIRL